MSLLTTLIEIQQQKETSDLQEKLRRATQILQTKNDKETLDLALEKILEESEEIIETENLTEETAVEMSMLNRIPQKKGFVVRANFTLSGRKKPMKYDFADFIEDENNI